MRNVLYIAAFAAICVIHDQVNAQSTTGVCTRTRGSVGYFSKYGTRLYYYSQSYSTCCSHFIFCWKRCSRTRTKSAYEGYYYQSSRTNYYTESYCCSGYSGNPPNCAPICSGGCGHGTCVEPNECSCQSGWTGQNCNNDINECSSSNGGCAHICTNRAGSYTCSCNSGYRLTSNDRGCTDINECSSSNGGCAHACTNSAGSYTCSCDNGYKLTSNGHGCTDINECAVSKGGCEQNCQNTVGSYHCTCNTGFILLEDQRNCKDHDECGSNKHDCDHQCHNTQGGYYCSCNNGYKLQQGTTNICIDNNECSINNGGCHQSCINKIGSYQCNCTDGYLLATNGHSCNDINECLEASSVCGQLCTNNIGSFTCSCNTGYQLSDSDYKTCFDINECSINNGGCNQSCINIVGSYQCNCTDGYLLSTDGHSCNDINECLSDNGGCQHNCNNTIGGHSCSCQDGYELNSDHTCDDINECTISNGQCDHTCHNTDGYYYCTCNVGYLLLEDQRGCTDHDECGSNKHDCDHQCHNTQGGYYCSCNNGYKLQQGTTTCIDINECQQSTSGCDQLCFNLQGSFYCSCVQGYVLSTQDNSTCSDINECSINNGGCHQSCINKVGSYQCNCTDGYLLATNGHACNDIDECLINNGGCEHDCNNTIGSYTCLCNTGYRINSTNGHTCYDVNECSEGVVDIGGLATSSLFWCDQKCVNTPGWYKCDCNSGYYLGNDNKTCIDINECTVSNGECEHTCHNTNGSYYCMCNVGYLLLEDQRGCTDHDECLNNIHGCDHECHNTLGGYYCDCHKGYILNGTTDCTDINECLEASLICDQLCTNNIGSFTCSCNTGYQLSDSDNKTCFDINECSINNGGCHQTCINIVGSYQCNCTEGYLLATNGHNCNDVNECLTSNGGCDHSCTNIIGSYNCTCTDGYSLENQHNCEDIDECSENIVKVGGVQPDSSEADDLWCQQACINTIGGFKCSCENGFVLNENNKTCSDIDECSILNGQCDHTCHNTIGSFYCTCNQGYIMLEDERGCTDHDECINNVHVCDHRCHNTRGGYQCSCFEGFKLQNVSHCIDVDECSDGLSNCTDICHNNIGSFYCSCFEGYYLSDKDFRTCLDVNECELGMSNCSQICINDPGTYHCNCDSGYYLKDLFSCSGEPCINLTIPTNAYVVCSGPKVTNEFCITTCDPGYTLIGSNNHTCQPNHTWTGEYTECQPMKCSQIIPPTNALVVSPCEDDFESTCTIVCDNGYHVSNSSDVNQFIVSCVLNDLNTTVEWAEAESCIKDDLCEGNPCNAGTCSVIQGELNCDCEGTFSIGERCEIGFFEISPIPPMKTNSNCKVTITAAPRIDINITLIPNDRMKLNIINGTSFFLPKSTTSVSVTYILNANTPGIYYVHYGLVPLHDIIMPNDSVIFVGPEDPESDIDNYFDGGAEGILVPGCCKFSVIENVCHTDLAFQSSCQWKAFSDNEWVSNGIVFISNNLISLPLSINGLRVGIESTAKPFLYGYSPNYELFPRDCSSCNHTSYDCSSVNSLNSIGLEDVELLLKSQTIAKTFTSSLTASFIPEWISVEVLSKKEGIASYSEYDYYSSLLSGNEIVLINECHSTIPSDNGHLYYVLRTQATILIQIDSFHQLVHASASKPHCVVVDMCDIRSPLFYYAIPNELQPSQLTNTFDYINYMLAGAGKLEFERIAFGKGGIIKNFDNGVKYWNGNNFIVPLVSPFDFELQTVFDKTFIGGNLEISCQFTGTLLHASDPDGQEKVPGLLIGSMILTMCTSVHGSFACLSLLSSDGISLFAYPGVSLASQSTMSYGMSFKLYANNATSVFSTLLPLPVTSCSVDGFMQVDSGLNVNNISLTSDCLGLKLGMLEFPQSFHHIIHLKGQNHLIANDHDQSIIIYSQLKAYRVKIGNFFEIFTNNLNSIAMEVDLDYKHVSTTGCIRNVNVSLFDSNMHVKELSINNEYLLFNGSTVMFNHFNIHVIGKSSTKNDINSLALELHAEIDGGFNAKLSNILNSHIKREVTLVVERQSIAHLKHIAAIDLYSNISNEYDNVQMEYNSLLLELSLTNKTYQNMKNKYQDAQDAFIYSLEEYSHNNMFDIDDVLCSKEFCNLECRDSNECSICHSVSKVTETEICETSLPKSRLITLYRSLEFQYWSYSTKCHDCWKLAWYLLPYFSPNKCCLTGSLPYSGYRNEPYQAIENYLHTGYNSCATGEIATNTSIQCCSNYTCAFKFHDIFCLTSNAECLSEKGKAMKLSGSPILYVQYQEYSTAVENLTESEIQLATIEAKLFVMKQELLLLEDAKYNAFIRKETRNTMEQTITNLTEQYKTQTNFSLNSISQFKILNISFDIILTDTTPVSFPLQFLVEYEEDVREITVIVDFQKSLESIYRYLSVEILANILSETGLRKKRDITSTNTQSNHYAITCAELANIKSFVKQIVDSIDIFQDQTKKNAEAINTMYLNLEFPPSMVGIETYNLLYSNLESNVNSLVSRLLKVLEYYSLTYWQNGQDMLYTNGSRVNEYNCIDQTDCLLIAIYDIFYILEDTPLKETQSIIENIASIKDGVLTSQYNVTHTRIAMNQLLELFLTIENLDYWCSEPPVFVGQPPLEMNLKVGETLELSCVVESKLPVTHYWMRNSLFLNFKTITLTIKDIQISEGGNYKCVVSNDAGSVSSTISTVNVYTPPIFNLSLAQEYETYVGNDNGFKLTCDALGLPAPGWRWLYKPTFNDDWKEISDSHSNVLTFAKVQLTNEGYYVCSAFNVIGNITSNSTFVRVLPTEIVQLMYPVEFVLSIQSKPTENEEFDSKLKELVMTRLEQNLFVNSTQIKSVSTFVRDGLHEVSFSLTTPYQTFDPNMNMQELVALLSPLITDLEITKNSVTYAVLEKIIDIDGVIIKLIPGSLYIGARHFACSDGYKTHSSLILCVGCSPGMHSGLLRTAFTNIGNGKNVEQVFHECGECSIGQYQENRAMTNCNDCPEYHSTISTGSFLHQHCLRLCEPNTVSINGFQPCVPCPDNYFQQNLGATRCVHCSEAKQSLESCSNAQNIYSYTTPNNMASANVNASFTPGFSSNKKSSFNDTAVVLMVSIFAVVIGVIFGLILILVIVIHFFKKKQKGLTTPNARVRENNAGHELTNIYEDIYKPDDDDDDDIKKDLGDDHCCYHNEPDYEELDHFVVVDDGVIQSDLDYMRPPLPPCNKQ